MARGLRVDERSREREAAGSSGVTARCHSVSQLQTRWTPCHRLRNQPWRELWRKFGASS